MNEKAPVYAMFVGNFCEVIDEYVDSDTLERMCVIIYHETKTRKNVKKELLAFCD